jgi:hypothetical protein
MAFRKYCWDDIRFSFFAPKTDFDFATISER